MFSPQSSTARSSLWRPRILIVDDQAVSRQILQRVIASIEPSAQLILCADAEEAFKRAQEATPDMVLTDYRMGGMDGIALTCALRGLPECADIPIVIVTAVEDNEVRYQALELGATDFLRKPIDPIECRARCRNLLRLHEHQQLVLERAHVLETRIEEATHTVRAREQEALWTLARAAEYRDEETGNHIVRMSKYSRLIAEGLGLRPEECDVIEMAAPMHDIGKIGIPDAILLKRGAHTPEEREIMRRHTTIGFEILRHSDSKYLRLGADIAIGHHERYDGTGYPKRLAREAIPIAARVVAVADVFDALTSVRPYKSAWPLAQALDYVRDNAGTQFDPACAESFLQQVEGIVYIAEQFRDAAAEARNGGESEGSENS